MPKKIRFYVITEKKKIFKHLTEEEPEGKRRKLLKFVTIKTMETRLQSSEVRIPKPVNSPQSPPIVVGCPTFKSSFARSLTFSNNNSNHQQAHHHKPLDLEISFRIAQALDATSSTQATAAAAAAAAASQHKHNLSLNRTSASSAPSASMANLMDHVIVGGHDDDDDFEEFLKNSPLKHHQQSTQQTMQNKFVNTTSPLSPINGVGYVVSSSTRSFCSNRQRLQVRNFFLSYGEK